MGQAGQGATAPGLGPEDEILNSILSSPGVNTAILDKDGVILHVNEGWMNFARENGAVLEGVGVGANYIDICLRAAKQSADAAISLDGILAVLKGVRPYFLHSYPCDSDTERRWFVMRVSPLNIGNCVLLIAHEREEATVAAGLRYFEILDSAHAIIFAVEVPSLRTTYVSMQIRDVLGYAPEQVVEEADFWRDHLHPRDRERVLEQTLSAIRACQKHSIEFRMIGAAGQVVWLRSTVNVIVENGEPVRVIGVSVDITDQKRAEAALVASEDKYRKIFQYAATGISVAELNGRFVESNQAFRDILGYTEQELHKIHLETLIYPEDRDATFEQLRRLKNQEIPFYSLENRYVRKNGDPVWVHRVVSLFTDMDGKPAYIVGLLTDVSERRRVLEELQKSEERFRATFEQAAVGIAHVALDGTFIRLNRRFCEIAGYDHDELLQTRWQEITHPDDLNSDSVEAQRLLAGEIPTYTMEKRYLHKDGSIVWISLTRSLVRENNQPSYFITVVQDISARKEAEFALSELSGRVLNAQEEERTRLARELHDGVGQQLAIVKMQVSKLAQAPTGNQARDEIGYIAEKLKAVSAEISHISRQLHPAVLHYVGIGGALSALCKETASAGGGRIECSIDRLERRPAPEIELCLFRIAQEALQNAGKHAKASQVDVELRQCEDDVVLTIRDNGVGFSLGSASRGVGLMSMRERIRFVDGNLLIDSEPGRGTTIEARVPSQWCATLDSPSGGEEELPPR